MPKKGPFTVNDLAEALRASEAFAGDLLASAGRDGQETASDGGERRRPAGAGTLTAKRESEAVMQRLLESSNLLNPIVPASRSAASVQGTAIDTAGFDEANYVLALGAVTDTITADLEIQESDSVNGPFVKITGAEIVRLVGTDDNKVAGVGVRIGGRAAGTRKRYQSPYLTIAQAGTALCGVTCILSGAQSQPVVNSPASVLV
jgi:hypothetical protein